MQKILGFERFETLKTDYFLRFWFTVLPYYWSIFCQILNQKLVKIAK